MGKRPSAAARRGSPRPRVADGSQTDAGAGADGGEPRATSSRWRRRQAVPLPHGWAMASCVQGSRGRSQFGVGMREEGRRERVVTNERKVGRVEGSGRMSVGQKERNTHGLNEHQNGKSTRTVNRPLREPFWVRQARPIPRHAGVQLHEPEPRTGTGTGTGERNHSSSRFSSRCDGGWTGGIDRWACNCLFHFFSSLYNNNNNNNEGHVLENLSLYSRLRLFTIDTGSSRLCLQAAERGNGHGRSHGL